MISFPLPSFPPQAQLCIILVLVVVTLLFEWSKDLIEERFHSYRPVLERVWGELTVLGFLALCTFLMIQSEVLQYFSKLAFGDEEHMVRRAWGKRGVWGLCVLRPEAFICSAALHPPSCAPTSTAPIPLH
jgi:hypothetical protein